MDANASTLLHWNRIPVNSSSEIASRIYLLRHYRSSPSATLCICENDFISINASEIEIGEIKINCLRISSPSSPLKSINCKPSEIFLLHLHKVRY
ncbi:hypothetical protein LXL04_031846 [Taraxacum kok-saghyz]